MSLQRLDAYSHMGLEKLTVLFAQLQVISHGLNCKRGMQRLFLHAAVGSRTYEQGIADCIGQGQKNTVFVTA